MKLGIVIRKPIFISLRIFMNVYRTQCFQAFVRLEDQ